MTPPSLRASEPARAPDIVADVATADDDARAVLDAAGRRARALADRDAEALRALHHPALRWTTHRGTLLDRDAYVAGNTEGNLVWRRQRLDEPHVVVCGDTAVLTAVVLDEVERDGESAVFRLRLTQTWVRDGDGWLCLAGHAGPTID